MKNSFNLEILKTNRILNKLEQDLFREKLKHLLTLEGIKSMCLEHKELYVEYNPNKFNIESFKAVLIDIGFPLEEKLTFSALHISSQSKQAISI
jgi:hypothetical protein